MWESPHLRFPRAVGRVGERTALSSGLPGFPSDRHFHRCFWQTLRNQVSPSVRPDLVWGFLSRISQGFSARSPGRRSVDLAFCVFRSKWASDSTGSGTRFRLKRDMIPLGSGPHFGLERNAVPHGTESRPAWNGTGDGGVESEQAALVIPGRCFPEVKGEYFARTEITHEKNTRNPTPPF